MVVFVILEKFAIKQSNIKLYNFFSFEFPER